MDEVLVERVAFDQAEGLDPLELVAQERREATVELDRGHFRPRSEKRAGQQAESRADLEDPPARSGVRFGKDRVEDVGVGQEVL